MQSLRRCLSLLWMLLPASLPAQPPVHPDTALVLDALLDRRPDAHLCFDDSALSVAHRLGITYEHVRDKCLISYEIDDSVKALLRSGHVAYSVEVAPCGQRFDRLTISAPQISVAKEFYFHDGRLTSPFFCFTEGWTTLTSTYVTCVVSDTALTNRDAIRKLEEFVVHTGALLGFSREDFAALEQGKVLYYLCANETEIERLTGYRTRGMYNLAYDAIVSTYNAHVHELTHLLVNFRLRRTRLLAHPFLQEGLAVALGGRGGLEGDVVMRLGIYLHDADMLSPLTLLGRSAFQSMDASLSYPSAGLYNRFLLTSLGADRYLEVYRRHCGAAGDSALETISTAELPPERDWKVFLHSYGSEPTIELRTAGPEDRLLWKADSAEIYENGTSYIFHVRPPFLFGPAGSTGGYRSNRFAELFPAAAYDGRRYLCLADSQSVSVYDLHTNILIASYAAAFELPPRMVPVIDGMVSFAIARRSFQGNPFEDPTH